jgi:hypothetical protein
LPFKYVFSLKRFPPKKGENLMQKTYTTLVYFSNQNLKQYMEVHTCSACLKHSDKMMLSVPKGNLQCCFQMCIAKAVTFMACDVCSHHTDQQVDSICEACSSWRPIAVTGFTLDHCENTGLCEPMVLSTNNGIYVQESS